MDKELLDDLFIKGRVAEFGERFSLNQITQKLLDRAIRMTIKQESRNVLRKKALRALDLDEDFKSKTKTRKPKKLDPKILTTLDKDETEDYVERTINVSD